MVLASGQSPIRKPMQHSRRLRRLGSKSCAQGPVHPKWLVRGLGGCDEALEHDREAEQEEEETSQEQRAAAYGEQVNQDNAARSPEIPPPTWGW